MKDSKRLVSLLIVLSIDAFPIYSLETSISTHWRKTIQCPLWSIFKRGRIAFQRTQTRPIFCYQPPLNLPQNPLPTHRATKMTGDFSHFDVEDARRLFGDEIVEQVIDSTKK